MKGIAITAGRGGEGIDLINASVYVVGDPQCRNHVNEPRSAKVTQRFEKRRGFCVITTAINAQNSAAARGGAATENQDRVELWRGKTIMVFTPHPDDDVFGCGGVMAMLARNGNKIIVVIYTNDNKGSFDLEMTSERLARIRKAEQEAAMEVIGVLAARQDSIRSNQRRGGLQSISAVRD